ncbi:MAG: WecB/TagA/CpsF family glycosyltransferase [Bacteroidota bacterium]
MDSESLNGVNVYVPSSRDTLITHALENKNILVAVNAEKILHATEKTRAIINRNLGYPDGIGAVWALQKKGHKNAVKIPGVELWLDIIKKYYQSKTFYLIGGKDDIIEKTIVQLKQQFPSISILSYRNGYLQGTEERKALIKDVNAKKPDIVFVAMGSPKQELLMEEMSKMHPALYQGLGGSFDVYTGNVQRAPSWWVKNNLEWAYRLLRQPSRIKRQIHLVRFYIKLKLNNF